MSTLAAPRQPDHFSQAMAEIMRPRTAAATDTRKAKRTASMAVDLGGRLEFLPDEHLATLAGVLTAECLARGLAVPDLRA